MTSFFGVEGAVLKTHKGGGWVAQDPLKGVGGTIAILVIESCQEPILKGT